MAAACCLLVAIVLLAAQSALAATRYYNFTIAYANIAPDCVSAKKPVINGAYPGPEIRATDGDTLVIRMCNYLTEPFAMHWHGLHMKGQPWQDGSAYGPQCPIEVNKCTTYKYTIIDQHGTYWYHGHIGLIRGTLYGPLIIDPKPGFKLPYAKPYGEHTLLLNDWYHRSTEDIQAGLESSTSWRFIGEPDSLLINGRGKVDCTTYTCPVQVLPSPCGVCNTKSALCQYSTFGVIPGKTYLFRVLNVALWAQMNFQIEAHKMTIVAIDGKFVKPLVVDHFDFLPAMTFNVLITFNQAPRDYWIAGNGRYDNLGVPPAQAVLHYIGSCGKAGCLHPIPRSPVPLGPDYKDLAYSPRQQASYKNLHTMPASLAKRKVDNYFGVRFTMNLNGANIRYAINNHSFYNSYTPLLASEYFGYEQVFTVNALPRFPPKLPAIASLGPAAYRTNVLTVYEGQWVQIVIQNHIPPGGNHPWHLHGYDFYVLGSFLGEYDYAKEAQYARSYNLVDPPQRNMVTVYEGHFVVIRFLADNVGLWNMHCHMEPHMHLGMNMFVRVKGVKTKLPPPPLDFVQCGRHPASFKHA